MTFTYLTFKVYKKKVQIIPLLKKTLKFALWQNLKIRLMNLSFYNIYNYSLFAFNKAYAYCMEPSKPYCINSFSNWDDYDFNNSKRDISKFANDMEEYKVSEQGIYLS